MTRDKTGIIANNFDFIVFSVFTFLFIFVSIGIPFWGLDFSKIDRSAQVDPAIVNGILTVTTLVFGIVVFEVREFETNIVKRFCLIGIPLVYLLIGVKKYFDDAVTVKAPTLDTLTWITSVFFFMILYQIVLIAFKKLKK
jgi:hypothetical protein